MKALKTSALVGVLRKFTSAENVQGSLQIMRKLGKGGSGELTHREAAELVYLSCGTEAVTRARNAFAMERSNTPAGNLVNNLQRQFSNGQHQELDNMPAAMLQEVVQLFARAESKVREKQDTPGFYKGKPIQVRGGSSKNWKQHATSYVIPTETP